MRVVCVVVACLVLGACAGVPTVRTSLSTPGDSPAWVQGSTEAMRHRSFYEDGAELTPAWMKAVAQPNR